MFCDTSYHTMDAKHRVFVPKRFQQELSRDADGNVQAFLTLGFEGCLFLFSKEGFAEVRARLDTQPFSGTKARNMQRLFFSLTQQVQLDASGRMLIPEQLRTRVGIEKEVVMVGVADRAEIWPKDRWEEFQAANAADFDLLDQVLCGPPGGAGGAAEERS
jgi:MraZ protein